MRYNLGSRPKERVSFESCAFKKRINVVPPVLPPTTTIWAGWLLGITSTHARMDSAAAEDVGGLCWVNGACGWTNVKGRGRGQRN